MNASDRARDPPAPRPGRAGPAGTADRSLPEPPRPPRPRWRAWLDLIRWDRPAGWLLLLWPSLSALWLAADGFPGWRLLAVFVAGTILMRSAGCCVNDVADRDIDRHVQRTARRPVTSGEIPVREALALGAVLALGAFALVLATNPPTILLSFAALAIAIAYPWAKRVVSMPQAVLGIAFSFGIPMAFAAVLGAPRWGLDAVRAAVPAAAWALLAVNLLWVLAYDTAYAMVDRDDDRHLGIRTSALTLGRWDVAAVTAFELLHLGGWLWLGRRAFGLGTVFVAIVLVVGGAQAVWHWRLIRERRREGCFEAFRRHHWLGATVFAAVVLDGLARRAGIG